MENVPPPQAGPIVLGAVVDVAAGAWTDIVGVYGPAEAAPGDLVSIRVDVKNLASYGIYIAVTGVFDSTTLSFSPGYAGVDPGATYSFTASFTMPANAVTITVYSFYWTGSEWYQDDHAANSISVMTPQFQGFSIAQYNKV